MNAKTKQTLKAAAVGAGLIAVALLPTGCTSTTQGGGGINENLMPAPGVVHTTVAPPTAI
jgi:hypothetical protein